MEATTALGTTAKSASIYDSKESSGGTAQFCSHSSSLQTSEGCFGAGLGGGGSTGTRSIGSSLCSSLPPSFLKETTRAHPGGIQHLQGDQMNFSHVLPTACKAQGVLWLFHALHQILLRFPTPNSSLLTPHSSVMLSSPLVQNTRLIKKKINPKFKNPKQTQSSPDSPAVNDFIRTRGA